jgi:hypothetical protein
MQIVGWYISPSVESYLEGFEFASLSFDFMSYESVSGVEVFSDFIETPVRLNDLESVGFESASTISNHFGLLINVFWLILFHLSFLLIRRILLKYPLKDSIQKLLDSFTNFFILTVYIRLLLEAYLFMLLSGLFEFGYFDFTDASTIVSFLLATPLTVFIVIFSVFLTVHYFQNKRIENDKITKKYQELYASVKDTKIGKAYTFVFILRRTAIVLVLLTINFSPVLFRVIMFTFIQVLAVGFIIMRPFEAFKDNLIEILNDSMFAVV